MQSTSLPTKKLFLIGAPIILLSIIFVMMRGPFTNQRNTDLETISTVQNGANLPRFNTTDTDGDGLQDWEEALWGTDPNSAFSEGRSVSDSDYVKTLIASKPNGGFGSVASTSNLTEVLGINFFNEYIALKQSNKLTNDTIASLTSRMSSDLLLTGSLQSTFSVPEELIFNDNNNFEQIKQYGNAIAEIRARYQAKYQQNPLTQSDFESTDTNQTIILAGDLYRDMAKELSLLRVPRLAVSIHESLVRSYFSSSEAFYAIGKVNIDPMKGMVGLQTHNEATVAEIDAVQNLGRYFSQSGIIFNTNEAGSIWSSQ